MGRVFLLFSSLTKKMSLSMHIPTAPPGWGAFGRSQTLLCVVFQERSSSLKQFLLEWRAPKPPVPLPTHMCRLFLPNIAGFLPCHPGSFSLLLWQLGKWLLWVCQKRTPVSNSPPKPLESQEVFIIDKINLTRYLRTLLKSFILLLTQAAQED